MAKLKIDDEWYTSPGESESGKLIMVTGRCRLQRVIESGKFNDRIEITWRYTPDKDGMPDYETSSLMEKVTDALQDELSHDNAALMTGIYTGDGQRNWIFYTINPRIFQSILNRALADFELLPLELYAEKDPEWLEYKEMVEQAGITDIAEQ